MSDVNFERDSFEAWYIAGVRKAVPAFAECSDSEIREGCMRPENDSYRIDSARIALEAWQARAALGATPKQPRKWFCLSLFTQCV